MEEGNEDILAVPQDVFHELLSSQWPALSKPFTKVNIDRSSLA